MNQWFGEPWPSASFRADVCRDDRFRIPTPVGEPCMGCGEEIAETDQGIAYPGFITSDPDCPGRPIFDPTPLYQHLDCQLRSVLGCSARCRGETCDHEGSYRDDARRVKIWLDLGGAEERVN